MRNWRKGIGERRKMVRGVAAPGGLGLGLAECLYKGRNLVGDGDYSQVHGVVWRQGGDSMSTSETLTMTIREV